MGDTRRTSAAFSIAEEASKTSPYDAANKVASVTIGFWILKICVTTLGETAGDLFSMTFGIGYAASSLLLLGFFVVTLIAQLRAEHFYPPLYWAVVLATSTAGTTVSDFMDRTLGLGYVVGTALLIVVLLFVLALWLWNVGTLSVERIRGPKAEGFYWSAILVSNTLGTALGDCLADSSGLGFLGGASLVGAAIAVLASLYFLPRVNRIALFWAAFVLTRPFGATFGDLLTKGHDLGGLGFGTAGSSAVLATVLVVGLLIAQRTSRTKGSP